MLRRLLRTAAGAAALAAALGAPAAEAVTLPTGFVTSREVSGLTRATKVVWAPDGRRFVVEKDGLLKVAAAGGTSTQTILDIRSDVNNFSDRGLLGLAIDSDFPNNPYLYLLYTYDVNKATTSPGPDASAATVSQLRRVTIGANSQVVAQQVILGTHTSGPCPTPSNTVNCIPSDGTSHSIGTVLSAPDGTLFVGSGDGANYSVADPRSLRVYNEQSMAGKIMHIDRNGNGLPGHPFCPSETNLTRVCTKLWAKGLRNPFRFTRLTSGALLVADVGWNQYEELDLVTTGGKSFGWPCYEGPIRTPTWRDKPECAAEYAKEGTANAHVGPIHSYWHNYAQHPSWAVIAGPEYTGDDYPAGFRGTMFWGDHGVGFMKRLALSPTGQVASMHDFIADEWHGVDLTAAPNGDIAWVDLGGWQSGQAFVDRMVYSPGNAKPNAVAAATPTSGNAPLTVAFDGSGSTDPDGDTLSYSWDWGDDTPDGSGAKPSHTYTGAGTYTATLTVSDGRGQSDTDTIQINASNTPPVPVIEIPTADFEYRNGVPVQVRGSATDAEQGSLPASAFEWNTRIVHHDHEHSMGNPEGVKEFSFEPSRDHDADSFYRIRLTVTDAGGASRSVEREIQPETVPLHLRSVPTGAPLSYAGNPATAPFDTDTTIGFIGTVSAPATFTSGGVTRQFLSWSSGAARVHNFTVPASETTLTATYNAAPVADASATPANGAAPLAVNFDASGSSDADGDALTYSWSFGDGTPAGTGAEPSHTYTAPGTYTATVTVSDGRGASDTDTVQVTATNSAPVASIDTPAAGSKYRDGTPVSVSGSANDAQDGSLPASAFAWNVKLVHGGHEHAMTSQTGVKTFQFTPRTDHDADSHYVIRLTVTDAHGSSHAVERRIDPETVDLHLRSVPSGAPLSYGLSSVTAPFDTTAAVGFATTVEAASSFISGGVTRHFIGWSDGGARSHGISVPASETTLTATYNARPTAAVSATPSSGDAPLAVSFDASGSSDVDGDALSYSWDWGDGTPGGTGATPGHTYTAPGFYTATVTVSDGRGGSDTETVQVSAGNTGPLPSIDTPAAGATYRDGTAVPVSGSATDAQQGSLPASAFAWNVNLVHGGHEHAIASQTGVKTFQFTPRTDHDADSHYVIRLTVTDGEGSSQSVERTIEAETVPVHLRSDSPGAPLTYGTSAVTAPWDTDSAIGFATTVAAAASYESGGITREFVGWSSGAARSHAFTVPATETTLTADYNGRPQAVADSAADWVTLGEEHAFDGSDSSDADGDALAYEWDFGDGSAPSTDIAPAHTYAALGSYDVTLSVSDVLGATATQTLTVAVTDGEPPPDPDPPAEPPPDDGAPPPPDETTPPPTDSQQSDDDTAGPRIRPWRPRARPRFLAGLVTDPAGVDAMRLAVATLGGKGRCRWVTGSEPRLGRRSACSPRQWLQASIDGRRWELPLPARLVPGRYRVWFFAVDRLGNVTRETVDGSGQLRFAVTRAAAASSCDGALLLRPLRCGGLAG